MIVLDASTAILLAKAELLDAFVETVGQPVVMPKEVERECYGRREALDAHLIARAITEKRITVRVVRQQKQYEKLRCDFSLGRGEAEAVTLALASEGALVATDDRQAINACKLLKIPFITALTVLVHMREKGLVSTEEARSKLDMLARYGRYRERTIDAARLELEGK
jgi:predicted nucleic acid-binding protein